MPCPSAGRWLVSAHNSALRRQHMVAMCHARAPMPAHSSPTAAITRPAPAVVDANVLFLEAGASRLRLLRLAVVFAAAHTGPHQQCSGGEGVRVRARTCYCCRCCCHHPGRRSLLPSLVFTNISQPRRSLAPHPHSKMYLLCVSSPWLQIVHSTLCHEPPGVARGSRACAGSSVCALSEHSHGGGRRGLGRRGVAGR